MRNLSDYHIHNCNPDNTWYQYDPPSTLRALYFNDGGHGVRPLREYQGFSTRAHKTCNKRFSRASTGKHAGLYDFHVRVWCVARWGRGGGGGGGYVCVLPHLLDLR